MRARGFAAAVGAAVLCWAAAGSAQAAPAGHVRVAIGSGASFPDVGLTAQRQDVVILQSWELARRAALKAADPSVKVLVYKNLSAMTYGRGPGGLSSSGVNWDEADGANPGWFLKNTSGQRFTWSGYSFLWAADVGDAGYQKRWGDNVVAELQANGWDGVFMDDVNATIKYHYTASAVAKYPSDAAYGGAMRAMVAAVAPRVRAAGKLAFANMLFAEYASQSRDWLQFLDGGMDEMFGKWDTRAGMGYRYEGGWEGQVDNVKWAEANGKSILAVTQSANTDAQAARYGWGSVLLAAGGRARFALHGDYDSEPWFAEFDYPIGDPAGPESKGADGVHRRAFANGLVLVNASDQTRAVQFGGAYSGSGLTAATQASMPPKTALILTRDPAPTPAPRPAGKKKRSRLAATASSSAAQPASARVVRVRARHGAVTVRIACRGAVGQTCRQRLRLTSQAAAASATAATFTVRAGHTRGARLRLDRRAARELARAGHVNVRLDIAMESPARRIVRLLAFRT